MAEPSPSHSRIRRFLSNGRYELLKKLGAGGMGVVWLARDNTTGQEVVVKLPHLSLLLERAEFAQRFEREVRTLKRLLHPNIVPILDVGQEGQVPYVVLMYLTGGSLHDRLQAVRGRKDPRDLAFWLADVASALDFMHTQGYVHRDIKPANILFDAVGKAYLCDFGLAKLINPNQSSMQLTRTGGLIGTPAYFAPEIAIGSSEIDHQSDQYSLAVVVYEVLAGRLPFQSDTPQGYIVQHASMPHTPIHLLNPLVTMEQSEVLSRALEKEPRLRFASCGEFAAVLLASVDDPSVLKRSSSYVMPDSQASLPVTGPVKGTTHFSVAGQRQTITNAPPSRSSTRPSGQTPSSHTPSSHTPSSQTLTAPPNSRSVNDTIRYDRQHQQRKRGRSRWLVLAVFLVGLLAGGSIVGFRLYQQSVNSSLAQGGTDTDTGKTQPSTPVNLPIVTTDAPISTKAAEPPKFARPDPQPNNLPTNLQKSINTDEPARRLHSIQVAPNQAVQVLLSPDGKWAVTGDVLGRVSVWDVQTGQKIRELGQFDSPVGKLAISGDGRVVAACGSDAQRMMPNWYDRHVRVWRLTTGKQILEYGLVGPPLDLALDQTGERLAVATRSRGVLLWLDLRPSQPPEVIVPLEPERKAYQAVAFTNDGDQLVTIGRSWKGDDYDIECRRISDGKLLTTRYYHEPLHALSLSQNGQIYVIGYKDGQLHAQRLDGMTAKASNKPHTDSVTGLCVRGQTVISVSRDGSIRQCQFPKLDKMLVLESGNGPISSLAVSEDGRLIAVGLEDGRMLIARLEKE